VSNTGLFSKIFTYIFSIFLFESVKGACPKIISKARIPKDQISIYLSYPLFRMISGAKYSGVPAKVYVLSWVIFERPKSVSLM